MNVVAAVQRPSCITYNIEAIQTYTNKVTVWNDVTWQSKRHERSEVENREEVYNTTQELFIKEQNYGKIYRKHRYMKKFQDRNSKWVDRFMVGICLCTVLENPCVGLAPCGRSSGGMVSMTCRVPLISTLFLLKFPEPIAYSFDIHNFTVLNKRDRKKHSFIHCIWFSFRL